MMLVAPGGTRSDDRFRSSLRSPAGLVRAARKHDPGKGQPEKYASPGVVTSNQRRDRRCDRSLQAPERSSLGCRSGRRRRRTLVLAPAGPTRLRRGFDGAVTERPTFTAWLAGRTPLQLAAVLDRRPDATWGPPSGLDDLASRLSQPGSVVNA